MAEMLDTQERTEEATPRALDKAREEGRFARSPQLVSAAQIAILAAFALVLGGSWAGTGRELMRSGVAEMTEWSQRDLSVADGALLLRSVLPSVAELSTGPVVAVVLAALFLALCQTGGLRFSFAALAIRGDKVLPSEGLKKMLSMKAVARTVGALLRLLAVVGVVALLVRLSLPKVAAMAVLPLEAGAARWAGLCIGVLAAMGVALLVLGVIDYAYQRWQWRRDLRMSRQQVKEEVKTSDGDPEMKARQARRRRDQRERSLEQAIREATVVVTNPTHFAVALRYEEGESTAPVVKAKGVDELAQEIRRLARSADIPVIEQPPLARALYRDVPVGRPIPESLYRAVADLIAMVFRLRDRRATAAGGR